MSVGTEILIGRIDLMRWTLLRQEVSVVEVILSEKEGPMLSRCANPDCSAPYDAGRGHGRFFRFRRNAPLSAPAPNSHSVQHHWLCESCSRVYTLDYRAPIGVLLSLRLRMPDDGFIPLRIAEA